MSFIQEEYIEQYNSNRNPTLISIVVFAIITLIMFYFGVYKQNGLIVTGIVISFALIYFFIKYPRFWIYSITFGLIIFLRSAGEGVSVLDVLSGILYLITLFIWLIWQFAIKREKLITNIGDWFIIAFFILLVGNSVIAVAHGVTFIDWLREYSIMALVLFYFPIRHYFKEKKHLVRLLILLGLVIILVDLQQFYDYYRMGITKMVYAYQMLSSTRVNQELYTTACAAGILFVLFEKKLYKQIILLIFTTINMLALISTFSRTFWLILLLQVILFIFIVPFRQKMKLVTYSLLVSIVIIMSVFLVFKDKSTVAFKVIENRFASSTKGKKDVSVVARLVEYEVVLKRIAEYPLGGNGLAKKFSFYFPVRGFTVHTITMHNGYLFLFYRLGIPLSLFYIFFLLFFTVKSFLLYFKSSENLYRVISLGAFCGLMVMIISDFSTNLFNMRDGVFIIAFAFALTQLAENKLNENKKIVL